MSPLELLVRLQGVNRDWDEKAQLYESVKKQLADQSELVSRRATHGRLADELSATRGGLRDSELALDSLHERARKVEAELYGGHIRSPKELENLRKDGEQLRGRISQLEDQVLLAMTQVDELEEAARQGEQELRAFEAEWQEMRRSLATQHEALRTSLRQLQQVRAELRGQLGRAELGLYDELRAKKAGMALSPMKHGICQTCRVTVPTYKAQVVESRRAVVTCEGCGRILYGG